MEHYQLSPGKVSIATFDDVSIHSLGHIPENGSSPYPREQRLYKALHEKYGIFRVEFSSPFAFIYGPHHVDPRPFAVGGYIAIWLKDDYRMRRVCSGTFEMLESPRFGHLGSGGSFKLPPDLIDCMAPNDRGATSMYAYLAGSVFSSAESFAVFQDTLVVSLPESDVRTFSSYLKVLPRRFAPYTNMRIEYHSGPLLDEVSELFLTTPRNVPYVMRVGEDHIFQAREEKRRFRCIGTHLEIMRKASKFESFLSRPILATNEIFEKGERHIGSFYSCGRNQTAAIAHFPRLSRNLNITRNRMYLLKSCATAIAVSSSRSQVSTDGLVNPGDPVRSQETGNAHEKQPELNTILATSKDADTGSEEEDGWEALSCAHSVGHNDEASRDDDDGDDGDNSDDDDDDGWQVLK